jgi:hypothetical protein
MKMPRRKVSTLLKEHLFRRTKLQAVRQGKQISVVARTWNSLPASRRLIRHALAAADSLFDA